MYSIILYNIKILFKMKILNFTKMLYLLDSYLFNHKTKIISSGIDDLSKSYIIFESTIFYPQGGGQPGDCGVIYFGKNYIEIITAKYVDSEVRHYFNSAVEINFSPGDEVELFINKEKRLHNMKLHTAGQLIHNFIEKEYSLRTYKAHHFPLEAYIECEGKIEASEELKFLIQGKLNSELKKSLIVETSMVNKIKFESLHGQIKYYTDDEEIRVVTISNYPPVLCCGTHLKNINEIKEVVIKKIISKNSITKISYDVL